MLARPAAIENPFYLMVPDLLLLPLVVLATVATVIATQAVISGAYSLARQAMQLGFLPRLAIRHTSATHHGQIYHAAGQCRADGRRAASGRPFRTSSALASAYGIAVTSTMVVDGILGSWWCANCGIGNSGRRPRLVAPLVSSTPCFSPPTC